MRTNQPLESMNTPFLRTRGKLTPCPIVVGTAITTNTLKNQSPTYVYADLVSNGSAYSTGTLMHDVVTPGFNTLRSRGIIVNNAATRTENWESQQPFHGVNFMSHYTGSNPPTGTTLTSVTNSTNWLPDITSANFIFPSLEDIAAIRQQASNEAIANSKQRDLLGIVDIAESGKTLDLLRTQLGRFDRLVDGSLFRGSLHRARRSRTRVFEYSPVTPLGRAKQASGLWLEVQYGWIPLLYSIDGLVKALGEPSTLNKEPVVFRGSASSRNVVSQSHTVWGVTPWSNGVANRETTYTVSVDYNYYSRAGVLTRYKPSLRERLGLTISDIPLAGYELIPYSFVLDWFFDMNTYIAAAIPTPGKVDDASWNTLHKEEVTTFTYTRSDSAGSWTDYTGSAPGFTCSRSFGTRYWDRTPGIRAGLPSINLQFKSWKHVVSATALVLSNAKSRALSRI